MDDPRPLKMCVVGDNRVGKTAILSTYVLQQFPEEYAVSVFEHYGCTLKTKGKSYHLTLCDVPGDNHYATVRPLCYHYSSCYLLCFSIASRASFESILNKWYPEVNRFSPAAATILIGTKGDLFSDQEAASRNVDFVSREECLELMEKIGAYTFVECSAKKSINILPIFTNAVQAVIWSEKRLKIKSKFLSKSQSSLFNILS